MLGTVVKPRILLVDDELRTLELLGRALAIGDFEVELATSARSALDALRRVRFEAVVTDVFFEGCNDGEEILRASRDLQPHAAVVLMTGQPALETAVQAIKGGAYDYLPKPIDPVVLGAKLQRALRERSLERAGLAFGELVEILSGMVANTIERIDPYTAGHGGRTRRYCDLLAARCGIDAATREKLELAAIAHDYGKIFLDDLGFLTKPGPLTPSEYLAVQRHPGLGAEKLGRHVRLREVCQWIAEHHERWDGTGYPHRKRGTAISLPGRVLGVVEVFDSLATRRSYKDGWGLQKVLDYFAAQREQAFDPDVLDQFLPLLQARGEEWLARPSLDRSQRQSSVGAEGSAVP
ncbi:MAG: response regulator [Planctomycetes bacterium]|nr:response regulator [Planctomycetota bacterium]